MSDSLIAGRYELGQLIAQGGMGAAYRARDIRLNRLVVVKLPRLEPEIDTPEYRKRFHDEAQAAARFQHDHVVRIYDYGDDQGQLYIVMELVEGETMASLIKRRPAIYRKPRPRNWPWMPSATSATVPTAISRSSIRKWS